MKNENVIFTVAVHSLTAPTLNHSIDVHLQSHWHVSIWREHEGTRVVLLIYALTTSGYNSVLVTCTGLPDVPKRERKKKTCTRGCCDFDSIRLGVLVPIAVLNSMQGTQQHPGRRVSVCHRSHTHTHTYTNARWQLGVSD